MKRQTFNRLIAAANFAELFISEMAWNNPTGPVKLPTIEIDSVTYCPQAVADKCGFKVLVCEVDTIPTTSVCRRIDLKVRRFANDYVMIFVQRSGFHHLWLAPVRKVDKRDIVTTEYTTAAQSEFLFEKIDKLAFAFDERVTITDVRQRVQESFVVNSEKITKDFYAGFKKKHKAFVEFISGIDCTDTATKDRQWYASVMLNRLMFCYFIQKKGFLDGNTDYLQDKLRLVQRERGDGHFFRSFYIGFLRGLFHDGLNTPRHDEEFENTYGRIPYLNGGMFDEHKIEHDYADIDIADETFERLFNFFDRWNWHLDTRITASGKDINPDVLGYIFEQYINDRAQMGAYYTKEDITEYIGRNCILPYLFDQVRTSTKDSAKEFEPDGYVWRTLRESGDRYIFDAVKKGYKGFDRIPESIARGIITEDMHKEYSETPVGELPDSHIPLADLRSEWNTRTPEQWGLPNEIWRETIDRLQRCADILGKIGHGEITSINDFITYNLDIRTFATDLLAHGDSRFVGWFYHALQRVTILDPTCGSGAFLFAAMDILEPLYEICIDRMQEFNRENPAKFKEELAEITDKYRSNIQYFIFKSIILRNLYGVDIMVEATEIAKLRLFLKMVAVVDVDRRADNLGLDPLPDIDFNIRCGNTLVGYANKPQLNHDLSHPKDFLEEIANQEFKQQIDEEMKKVARAYDIFKDVQLRQAEDMLAFKQAKQELRKRLSVLNDKLNRRLFIANSGYRSNDGVDITTTEAYRDWLSSHLPFHWLAEFYQIIESNKGFDVIIGNPPYVVYTDSNLSYRIDSNYNTRNCSNLYAFCIERCDSLKRENGRFGMIVPNSSISAQKMLPVQNIITKNKFAWISNYSWRPAKLFEGADMLLAIILTVDSENPLTYATQYKKWYNEFRPYLFKTTSYCNVSETKISGSIPKIASYICFSIISKQMSISGNSHLSNSFLAKGQFHLYYFRAVQYWFKILTEEPIYDEDGEHKVTGEMKPIFTDSKISRDVLVSLLSSTTYFLHYIIWSSCQVVNSRDFNLYFDFSKLSRDNRSKLAALGETLQKDYQANSHIKERNYSKKGRSFTMRKQHFFIKYSKPIIDEIDAVLARHYGFTEEELDFIINYDIKYRMGDELNNADE